MVLRNSTPGGFAYIWPSEWVGIIAIKTERTQIHFLSDVLIAVASLDLKVPSEKQTTPPHVYLSYLVKETKKYYYNYSSCMPSFF